MSFNSSLIGFKHAGIGLAITALLAGGITCVLQAQSGVLVGHGFNNSGQLNAPATGIESIPILLSQDITSIKATAQQSYLLSSSGILWGAGNNGWRQWGEPARIETEFVQVAQSVSDFSADYTHLFTVDDQGVLRGSGYNSNSQLGHNAPTFVTSPLTIDSDVVQVSGNNAAITLWLKADGSLWGMGFNFGNALGIPGAGPAWTPYEVDQGVSRIITGGNNTFYLKSDGSFWGLGNNHWGELGLGHRTSQETPALIAEDVVDADSFANRTVFIKTDGSMWGMGFSQNGVLGRDMNDPQLVPRQIGSDVAKVSLSQYRTVYIDRQGAAWGMGRNTSGQLGLGDTLNRDEPVKIMEDVAEVSAGPWHTLFLKQDGTAWGAGMTRVGLMGTESIELLASPQRSDARISSIATDQGTTFFLRDDQTLWAVGRNEENHRGLDLLTDYSDNANLVATLVKKVSTGASHTLFLKQDNTVWIVGSRSFGRAGVVPAIQDITPSQVASNAVDVAAAGENSFYVDTAGVLWGAGQNASYQLGLGHNSPVFRFEQIATNVKAVSATDSHTLFVQYNGNLWGMGRDYNFSLGPNQEVRTPVLIATQVTAAAASDSNTYYLTTTGDLMGMGERSLGQLGIANDPIPSPIAHLVAQNVVNFDGGFRHLIWTDTAGNLWGLGSANNGQLGEPLVTSVTSPRLLARQVTALAAGHQHSLYAQVPEAYLTNLSTRINLKAENPGNLVAGLVISGTEPMDVLIRAVGPSLADYGVSSPLENPSFRIFDQNAEVIGSNDDWGSAYPDTIRSVAAELGAFALREDSTDAAAMVTLAPGAYTVHVERRANTAGTVLLEVYKREATQWRSRLMNLSVRNVTGSGEDAIIAGFVATGPQPSRLLVRAIGPTLNDYGVPNTLGDPELNVFSGQNAIGENDNWGGDKTITNTTATVGGFPLEDTSLDAATLIRLPAGAYTVQVSGDSDDDIGQALIEIYAVDE